MDNREREIPGPYHPITIGLNRGTARALMGMDPSSLVVSARSLDHRRRGRP